MDSGDGPAVFAIFIVGFVAVSVAFVTRFGFDAPIWMAFVVSALSAIGLSLGLLPPLKATLFALQFANDAEEGRQTGALTPDQQELHDKTPPSRAR